MGTRGLYGFRKNGIDKLTYNHFDSYPACLGAEVVDFCRRVSADEMDEMFDKIEVVKHNDTPTFVQIDFCRQAGWVDTDVSSGTEEDWYCLLRNAQGDLKGLKKVIDKYGKAYMLNDNDFIYDSLFCEYAYIINLDTRMLEFYDGFQKTPQLGNRYGESPNTDDFYPCKKVLEISLDCMGIGNAVTEFMKDAFFCIED